MRKLLTVSALLLVSLMANAGIKITNVPAENSDVITIDGKIGSNEAKGMRSARANTIITTAATVKVVTEDNYELNKDDIVNLLGSYKGDKSIINKQTTKELDFSDAKFVDEDINVHENLGEKISYFDNLEIFVWSKDEDVPEAICRGNKTIKRVVITGVGENKIIGKDAFQNCINLTSVDLPSGLETISTEAFEGCTNLRAISLPNTLTTICTNAFDNCGLEYIVIPENVETIEAQAFQRCDNLVGVYIMGSKAKCGLSGFDNVLTHTNFKNETTGFSEDEPAVSTDWENEGRHPLVLHITDDGTGETLKKYANPSWLMLNSETIEEDLKNFDGSEDAKKAFCEKYNIGENVFPWDLRDYVNGTSTNCPYAYYKYIGNDGKEHTTKLWRKGDNGRFDDNNFRKITEYAGFNQFMIIQDDAHQSTHTDTRILEDKWYSMCFPVDLTDSQLATAYGWGTEICEFDGVFESKDEDTNTNIYEFRFKSHPYSSANGVISQNANNTSATSSKAAGTVVTKAHKAYMIHPANKSANADGTPAARIIPDLSDSEWEEGKTTAPIATYPTVGENLVKEYEFIGYYDKDESVGDIPSGSWFFGYKSDGTFALNHSTKGKENAWKEYTALIRYVGNGTETVNTKNYRFLFSTAPKFNITTGIDNILIDKSNDFSTTSNKIFNLNGQVVKEGNDLSGLSKGIYIMNGKKYIVK